MSFKSKLKLAIGILLMITGVLLETGCQKKADDSSSSQTGFLPRIGV